MRTQATSIAAIIAPGQRLVAFTANTDVVCGTDRVFVTQSLQVKVPAGVTAATFSSITDALHGYDYTTQSERSGLIASRKGTGQGMSVLDESTGGIGIVRFNMETECGLHVAPLTLRVNGMSA